MCHHNYEFGLKYTCRYWVTLKMAKIVLGQEMASLKLLRGKGKWWKSKVKRPADNDAHNDHAPYRSYGGCAHRYLAFKTCLICRPSLVQSEIDQTC